MTNQSRTELAARKLAECMDYPWDHMPEAGREKMRQHAKAIVAAALESPERVLGEATGWKRCEACNGKGDSASGMTTCGGCHGSGRVAAPTPSPQAEKQPLSEADEALMRKALQALETGHDCAIEVANDVHEKYKGYKPERHAAVELDVLQIDSAITALSARLETPNAS